MKSLFFLLGILFISNVCAWNIDELLEQSVPDRTLETVEFISKEVDKNQTEPQSNKKAENNLSATGSNAKNDNSMPTTPSSLTKNTKKGCNCSESSTQSTIPKIVTHGGPNKFKTPTTDGKLDRFEATTSSTPKKLAVYSKNQVVLDTTQSTIPKIVTHGGPNKFKTPSTTQSTIPKIVTYGGPNKFKTPSTTQSTIPPQPNLQLSRASLKYNTFSFKKTNDKSNVSGQPNDNKFTSFRPMMTKPSKSVSGRPMNTGNSRNQATSPSPLRPTTNKADSNGTMSTQNLKRKKRSLSDIERIRVVGVFRKVGYWAFSMLSSFNMFY